MTGRPIGIMLLTVSFREEVLQEHMLWLIQKLNGCFKIMKMNSK